MLFITWALSSYAVKVVFRIDDPTVQYDSVYNRVFQMFVEKQVPLSVAVIPCDKEERPYVPNDTAYFSLLSNPNIEICLHGLTHTNIEKKGEFCQLDEEEIKRRIAKGKAILYNYFQRDLITFIPPHNILKASVTDILADNGFRVLSGDMFMTAPRSLQMQYYPETLGFMMGREGVWSAARKSIFNSRFTNSVCVIMFHNYDLLNENAWNSLELLLDDCKSNKSVELYTFASLYQSGEIADVSRYKANKLSGLLSRYLLSNGELYPTWYCYLIHALNSILYALIAIIGFIILLISRNGGDKKTLYIGVYICFAVLVACAAWWHWLTPLKLLALTLLATLGSIPFAIRKYKES